MSIDTARPYIASYLLVRRGDEIAFVLRSNTSWMNGYYGLPSGKVEKNESYVAAACREAQEEVGIIVLPENLRFVHAMHRHEELEWVDVYFEAGSWEGEPRNAEPALHGELAWFSLQQLPENVIPPTRTALGYITEGKTYSEYGWQDTAVS